MIWLARRMMFHNETAEQRMKAIYTNAAFRWGGKSQDIHMSAGGGAGETYDAMNAMYGDPEIAGSIGWCHDWVVAEATMTGGLMGHNQGQVAMGFNTVLFGQGYGSNGCLVGGTPIGYAVE